MSDPTSIFNNNQNPQTPANQDGNQGTPSNVPQDQALLTLLGEIKNERGEPKYKSLPDALNALKHSQEYIPQLTTQIAQKDSELATARAAAARIEELERSIQALTRPSDPPVTPTAGMTEEQVAEIVNRSLTANQAEAKRKENGNTVSTALISKFGQDAEKQFNAKAEELGIPVAELHALAGKSPKAVLAYFQLTPAATGAPPASTTNTAAVQPHQDTYVTRNKNSALIGATTEELIAERRNANAMVEELEAKGMSVHDLTDPKVYAKFFGRS